MKAFGCVLFAGILTACNVVADQCSEGSGPETVTVDASGYADLGLLTICVGSGSGAELDCFKDGTSVSTTLSGEYPDIYGYEVFLSESGTLLYEGTFSLSCEASAITVSVGSEE